MRFVRFWSSRALGWGALSFPTHSAMKLRNGWGTRLHGLIERNVSALFGTTEVVTCYKTQAEEARAFSFPTDSAMRLRNGWGTGLFCEHGEGWLA